MLKCVGANLYMWQFTYVQAHVNKFAKNIMNMVSKWINQGQEMDKPDPFHKIL